VLALLDQSCSFQLPAGARSDVDAAGVRLLRLRVRLRQQQRARRFGEGATARSRWPGFVVSSALVKQRCSRSLRVLVLLFKLTFRCVDFAQGKKKADGDKAKEEPQAEAQGTEDTKERQGNVGKAAWLDGWRGKAAAA
jgi:hypothetical protein